MAMTNAPTMVNQSIGFWMTLHQSQGHALTHVGSVFSDLDPTTNAPGYADIWFCQQDNQLCVDITS
jgi:hypothetical protein